MSRAILLTIVATVLAGCSRNTPTSPNQSENGVPQVMPLTVLFVNCQADGEDIACTAQTIATSASGVVEQDVTATAQWTAVPADLTQMVAPGRFRARRAGEVVITASTTPEARTLLPVRFLVAPGTPPRRLGTLLVLVRDPGGAPLTDAKVEVLGGYRAGATCTTFGGVCIIDSVVMTESFDVRGTRPGYQPATVPFRTIPLGPPSATVAITLSPQ
jgi:hypothetical protein